MVDTLRNLPNHLLVVLRCLFVVLVWGVAFPLLMAEVWNGVLGTDTYPLFATGEMGTWLPFSLNPLRIVVDGFKGVLMIGGLVLASASLFTMMEFIEAFLDHVAFIRAHRARRQNGAVQENVGNEPQINEDAPIAQNIDQDNNHQPEERIEVVPNTPPRPPRRRRRPSGLDVKPAWVRQPSDLWISDNLAPLDFDTIISHRKMILELAKDDTLRHYANIINNFFEWRAARSISTMGRLYNDKLIPSYWYAHYTTFIHKEAMRTSEMEVSFKRRFHNWFTLTASDIVNRTTHAYDNSANTDNSESSSHEGNTARTSLDRANPRDYGPSLSEDDEDYSPKDEYDEQTSDDPLHSPVVHESEAIDEAKYKILLDPFLSAESLADASVIAVLITLTHKILKHKQIHVNRGQQRRKKSEAASASSSSAPSSAGSTSKPSKTRSTKQLKLEQEELDVLEAVEAFMERVRQRNEESDLAYTTELESALEASAFHSIDVSSTSDQAQYSARSLSATSEQEGGGSFSDSLSKSLSKSRTSGIAISDSPRQSSDRIADVSHQHPQQNQNNMHADPEVVAEQQNEADNGNAEAPQNIQAPAGLQAQVEEPNNANNANEGDVNANQPPIAAVADDLAAQDEEELNGMFDDEDLVDHRTHWLLAIFGRRRRNENGEAVVGNAEDNGGDADAGGDGGFNELIGWSGNPLWSVFLLLFILGFTALAITLAVLVPQLVGKMLTRGWEVLSALVPEEEISAKPGNSAALWRFISLVNYLPNYLWKLASDYNMPTIAHVLALTNSWSQFVLPFVVDSVAALLSLASPMLQPLLDHPLTHIFLMPTALGYYVCIAAILCFCAKRSPLAISTRVIISIIIQCFIAPILVGAILTHCADSVIQLDDPNSRPPILNRHRASRSLQSSSNRMPKPINTLPSTMETLQVPWYQDLNEMTLLRKINDTLLASSAYKGVSPLLLLSYPGSMLLGGLHSLFAQANMSSKILNFGATGIAQTGVKGALKASKEIEVFIITVTEQVEATLTYIFMNFSVVLLQLLVGYIFILSWAWALRKLRKTIHPKMMWFLPGDPDNSPFLYVANRTMLRLLVHNAFSMVVVVTSALLFVAGPLKAAKYLSTTFGWKLFHVSLPTSSFQVFTDYNVGFTLVPVILALAKPGRTIPDLLHRLATYTAILFGVQNFLLVGYPLNENRAAHLQQQNQPDGQVVIGNAGENAADALGDQGEQGNHQEGEVRNEIQNANQGEGIGQDNIVRNDGENIVNANIRDNGPLAADRVIGGVEKGIRISLAVIFGCAMLSFGILSTIVVPWLVGSFVVRLSISDTDFLPMYTGTIGLFVLSVSIRVTMVYVKIYRLHLHLSRAIPEDDRVARADLRRSTFDNSFRATVLILILFVLAPILLGYLIEIVFFQSVLPPHVLVPLTWQLDEYVFGIMGMHLMAIFLKLPIAWLAPMRAVVDTLSFEEILDVDYYAFLNQVVYPVATIGLILGGAPSVANTILAFWFTDIPDDTLANLKRKMYALIPILVLSGISLYYTTMNVVRGMDQMVNGRVVVSRQIHNFNPNADEQDAPSEARQVTEENIDPPPPNQDHVARDIGHRIVDDGVENTIEEELDRQDFVELDKDQEKVELEVKENQNDLSEDHEANIGLSYEIPKPLIE